MLSTTSDINELGIINLSYSDLLIILQFVLGGNTKCVPVLIIEVFPLMSNCKFSPVNT